MIHKRIQHGSALDFWQAGSGAGTADCAMGGKPVTPEIQARVIDRLIDTGKADEPWALIVLAAIDGSDQLDQFLDKKVAVAPPKRTDVSAAVISESPGAYLASISVEGFR